MRDEAPPFSSVVAFAPPTKIYAYVLEEVPREGYDVRCEDLSRLLSRSPVKRKGYSNLTENFLSLSECDLQIPHQTPSKLYIPKHLQLSRFMA